MLGVGSGTVLGMFMYPKLTLVSLFTLLLVLSSITACMPPGLSPSCAKELISYSKFVFQTKILDLLTF